MDIKEAKRKLDHVIQLSRVEMYKPIQVAETLRSFANGSIADLNDLSSYRNLSRELRNKVTLQLLGKVSTSSMRYQDDVWNESALPPAAMVSLAKKNQNQFVEEYIYQHVYAKTSKVISIRKQLESENNLQAVESLFTNFDVDGLRSSADRLFEIFVLTVLQTQIDASNFSFSLLGQESTVPGESGLKIVELARSQGKKLEMSKLGHTNAADAGLDIWTNFGVVISVKNSELDKKLLEKILSDTPVGMLAIICDRVAPKMIAELRDMSKERPIVLITKTDLIQDAKRLLGSQALAKIFLDTVRSSFDREFPLAITLESFMQSRGYEIALPAENW